MLEESTGSYTTSTVWFVGRMFMIFDKYPTVYMWKKIHISKKHWQILLISILRAFTVQHFEKILIW